MATSEPTQKVKMALCILSGNQCAFPDCDAPIFKDGSIVGEICHIHGQREGSSRYRADLTDQEIHGIENLTLLCREHHKIVDDHEDQYDADWLRRVKREHESKSMSTPSSVLHRLIEALAPSVPEDWWERPGAPVFRLGLASSRRDPEWTYSVDVNQVDGGDIGKVRYQYKLGERDHEAADAFLRSRGKWHLEDLKFVPQGEPLELQLTFWWDGAPRSVTYRWAEERFFQGSDWEEVFR